MSFGSRWTGVEILVDQFIVQVGHPSRKPRRTALRRVDIFGLHNAWCANLTAFALVLTEWVKLATCVAPSWASDGNVMLFFGAWPTGFTAGVTLLCLELVFFAAPFADQ